MISLRIKSEKKKTVTEIVIFLLISVHFMTYSVYLFRSHIPIILLLCMSYYTYLPHKFHFELSENISNSIKFTSDYVIPTLSTGKYL
jgi:hypothetical protein